MALGSGVWQGPGCQAAAKWQLCVLVADGMGQGQGRGGAGRCRGRGMVAGRGWRGQVRQVGEGQRWEGQLWSHFKTKRSVAFQHENLPPS